MDMYKKEMLRGLFLVLVVIIGLILQWRGRMMEGIVGLSVQFLSLFILLTVLWIYNRRFR